MSSNRIEKIAIVGASGHVGKHLTEALLATGKHTITALTRADSKAAVPSGVKVAKVDYSDPASIVSALKGHQFLIITLSVRTPPETHGTIVKAAVEAGIQWIMPNNWGYDKNDKKLLEIDPYAAQSVQKCEEVAAAGANYVEMACGFWYEWSLVLGEQWYGFTIQDKKVTFFDDGNTKIVTSTWLQCGRALAGMLSLPLTKEGSGPAIENWKNDTLALSSFKISQRDMLDSLHRVLGTTDKDWDIKYEDSAKRVEDGQKEMQTGDMKGFAKQMYSRCFGHWKREGVQDTPANKILDLPVEDLDEATKRAVKMIEDGFNPFASWN